MKILVVDDEVFSRMKLQKIMENLGECEAVENGEDAKILQLHKFNHKLQLSGRCLKAS